MAEGRIVGPDGQPLERMQKKQLTQEIARANLTGVRNIWSHGSVASGLSPERLASILRNANEGDHNAYLTLAEEMEERDPHYASVLGTRKRAVSGLAYNVESPTDDADDVKRTDAVRDLIADPEFEDLLDDALDALGKGYSAVEIKWRRGTQWVPEQYIWRDPRFFRFDRVTGRQLRLLTDEDSFDGVELPPYKFVVHIPKLKSGLPIRGGLARLASIAYMCKAFTVTDWMAFAEVFGMPLRIGKHGPNATEGDIQTLVNAVANIGTDAAAVIPENMKIEFEETGGSRGGESLFERMANFFDKQVSKAVLGQTMTTDDGSSRAQAQVHNEVREDILRADAKQLQKTINRDLIQPFIDLNFGPQKRYPKFVLPVPDPEDLKALVEALDKLVPMGLKVEQSVVRDKLRIPDPAQGAKDEDLLQPPSQAGTPEPPSAANREKACPGCGVAHNREQPGGDYLDELEADALQDWEEQLQPIMDPLEKLLQASNSYQAFVDGLPAVLEEMDPAEVIQRLATANLKARGLGDATDDIRE